MIPTSPAVHEAAAQALPLVQAALDLLRTAADPDAGARGTSVFAFEVMNPLARARDGLIECADLHKGCSECGALTLDGADFCEAHTPAAEIDPLDASDLADLAAEFAPHTCACGARISAEASACFPCDPAQYESDRQFDVRVA